MLPQNFVIMQPGPTTNLLGPAVSIKNTHLNEFSSGELFSTTVYVTSPGKHPSGYQVLWAWIDGNMAVLPTNAVYETGVSATKAEAAQKSEMESSKVTAAMAAISFIKSVDKYSNQSWTPNDVSIDMEKAGGGSGGLAFALAMIAKSADPALIANRKIAVTGTITNDGKVGAIGGLDQKILGASASGAKVFLFPKEDCDIWSKRPAGMDFYAVSTLSEAVHALALSASPATIAEAKRSFSCPSNL
jgi:PDZ domain-containing protein